MPEANMRCTVTIVNIIKTDARLPARYFATSPYVTNRTGACFGGGGVGGIAGGGGM